MKRLIFILCLALLHLPAAATELRVAVAANFTATLERLAQAYAQQSDVRLAIISGSSGKHYAQIVQGAPFDLFFSADDQRTADLVGSGHAVADSRHAYADGILVLWSPDPDLIPADGVAFLKGDGYRRLAMANPRVAPYGAAAESVLTHYQVSPGRGRLVTGQSIGQTFNFITTGNAQVGFVALSQVITHERSHPPGSRWLPDASIYAPIIQEVVRLSSAQDPHAAQTFLDWVRLDPAARAIIEADGYRMPTH
ncbi:molybdenum ABC transporter, periplasmic molybdate-binding protein [Thioalkalivibrio sulfidiphilus HL-EbGr7]|uniref:Molybdenum ABC transporter, periplasmic molybdate-binding protein n=1 Tax=Thioalkalivibrio sulfidiphilus (strain HL-EbGR7) TaxID=396588 RepID=B8GRV2_THISH|nr:molybdate ABC transporter substrate-binding protein [Thioalkalivibrio sulfidiphilus]ACL72656.1 molybdenum ABC transporter, periplasmic molybdate-binding protein [Thioalkalivibrio sulfidiphilus HL-EbGr7]